MPRLTAVSGVRPPTRSVQSIERFLGVDLSNTPANVQKNRSPDAKNMMPDQAGKPVKRTGYCPINHFDGALHGYYYLEERDSHGSATSWEVAHAGTRLYDAATGRVLWGPTGNITDPGGMADAPSVGWQMNNRLWLLDGTTYLCVEVQSNPDYDIQNPDSPARILVARRVSEMAYVPTVVISRLATGGGTPYEPVNLISSYWCESFLAKAGDAVFQLSFDLLDERPVKAEYRKTAGVWAEVAASVDRDFGRVTLSLPADMAFIEGQDNLRITASRDWGSYPARINGCNLAVLYGVGSASDRLFVSGNPAHPNQDWYSQREDPTYFGDLWYSTLGQDGAKVTGYSIVGDRLATHKSGAENGRNVMLRQGQLISGQAAFPLVGALQGEGAIAPRSFGHVAAEPLFLTRLGVYAITEKDTTGERYTQNRSYYINQALIAAGEAALAEAVACVWRGFYLLAVGGRIYLLDSGQRAYEKNAPFSTYQYECYYWEGPVPTLLWSHDDKLYFGDALGGVYRFYTDANDPASYYDNGEPIDAYWETPDIDGTHFYRSKTIRHLAFRLMPAATTSVAVEAQVRGIWQPLFDDAGRAQVFSFGSLGFSRMRFSADTTPKTINQKLRIKKVDKTRLRLRNAEPGQPFGLYEMSVEYTEGGKY